MYASAVAQVSPAVDKGGVRDSITDVPQKDIVDVLKSAFHIKQSQQPKPPKKFYFSIFPGAGYTLQTRLAAIVASNVAFYTGKPDSAAKLSSITSSLAITQNKQIVLPLQMNIWSKDEK